jgi:putative peptide zinc metalloprotease protein
LSSVLGSRRLVAAVRPEEAARALAARHGPPEACPALRKDLNILRQVQLGEVQWIVKNPETLKYNQFKDAYWQIIRLFDGTRTRTQILDQLNQSRAHPLALDTVLEYEEFLRGKDLIEESPAERSLNLLDKYKGLREKKAEEKSQGFNIFFIMFHVLDPDRFMNRTIKYVWWIWTPIPVLVTLIASIWTAGIFSQHWNQLWTQTMELYHFLGKPILDILQFFLIISVIGGMHEFAHAFAIKRYGGECHDIGFALFYFTPAFYCDTSDAFMFENQLQRLWVTIAGIYYEVAVCSVATFLWVVSYPDTLLNQLAYKTMLFTGISAVFFNINPLIKVDGYYALSSLLKIPDLREAAWRQVGAWFQKNVLRLSVEIPTTTRRKRRLFWIYGLLSVAYTATIMTFIYRLFDNFYAKYFPDFGVVLLIVTLYYVFRKRVRTMVRVSKLFYLDKKDLIKSRRSRAPLAAVAVVLLLIFAVPWTRRTITAEALLKPEREVTVQSPEDGVVMGVFAHEGDTVAVGQPLFLVESAAIDTEAQRSLVARERFTRKSGSNRAVADAAMAYQAEARASAAQTAVETAQERQSFLTVRSPIAGRILTSRTEDLKGRYVAAGYSLANIGDCRKMVAELPVSERLLEYLKPGSPASARVQTRPMKTWAGSISMISPATLDQPVTAKAGKEPSAPSSTPDRFVALALFDNSDGTLLPGAAARVKIRSGRESYGSRGWSVVWRRLRSIFW